MKIGKFSINKDLIDKKPNIARILLKDIIIVRAEMSYMTGAIEYIGICERFENVPEGVHYTMPEYEIKQQGSYSRKITKIAGGPLIVKEPVPNLIDEDGDEDEDEPAPRRRPRPPLKSRPVDEDDGTGDGFCHNPNCPCDRPKPPADYRRPDLKPEPHPVVTATEKTAKSGPTSPDYLNITRNAVSRG